MSFRFYSSEQQRELKITKDLIAKEKVLAAKELESFDYVSEVSEKLFHKLGFVYNSPDHQKLNQVLYNLSYNTYSEFWADQVTELLEKADEADRIIGSNYTGTMLSYLYIAAKKKDEMKAIVRWSTMWDDKFAPQVYEDINKVWWLDKYDEELQKYSYKQKTRERKVKEFETRIDSFKKFKMKKAREISSKKAEIRRLHSAQELADQGERLRAFKAGLIKDEATLVRIEKSFYNVQHGIGTTRTAIVNMVNRFKEALKNKRVKTALQFLKDIGSYTAPIIAFTAGNTMAEAGILLKHTFPAMFGYLPIPHVQAIEVARSGQILKFRATGTVFLANQKGSDDAIRIEFLILPNEQFQMIMMLWALFQYGRGKIEEIKLEGKGLPSIEKIREFAINMVSNNSLQKPSQVIHKTLPLITNHIILPNVYIETFVFEDLIVQGKDVLKCSLLLRTYEKPQKFIHHTSDFGLTYMAVETNRRSKMLAMLEFVANTAWRLAKSTVVVDNSWKSGVGEKNRTSGTDVYYEVDPTAIASTMALGALGITPMGAGLQLLSGVVATSAAISGIAQTNLKNKPTEETT